METTRNSFRRIFIVAFVMLFSANHFAPDVIAAERDIYVAAESFNWREFMRGQQIVKESGPLFAVGFTYFNIEDAVTVKPAIELFGGSVDYHGYACDPTGTICEAAATRVRYLGFKLAGDVGRRFNPARSFFIEPFGGLDFRFWRRDIGQGTTASGNPTAGYPEDWITLQGRLGVRTGIGQSKKQVFGEAGVKIPVFNQNTAYVSGIGQGPDVTLHPGRQAAYFAEAGIRIRRFKASFFYDTLRFSRSDVVDNGVIFALQPESRMDVYGVKLGISF